MGGGGRFGAGGEDLWLLSSVTEYPEPKDERD